MENLLVEDGTFSPEFFVTAERNISRNLTLAFRGHLEYENVYTSVSSILV